MINIKKLFRDYITGRGPGKSLQGACYGNDDDFNRNSTNASESHTVTFPKLTI